MMTSVPPPPQPNDEWKSPSSSKFKNRKGNNNNNKTKRDTSDPKQSRPGGNRNTQGGNRMSQQQGVGGNRNNDRRRGSVRKNGAAPSPKVVTPKQGSSPKQQRPPRNNNNNSNSNNSNNNNNNNNAIEYSMENVQLLQPGMGSTDQEKLVTRHSVSVFLACRLQYLDPPKKRECSFYKPHGKCLWKDPDRKEQIEAAWQLYAAPLEVNEETRWKSRVMKQDNEEAATAETDAEQARQVAGAKTLALLNKLSWTNLDKLTRAWVASLQQTDNNSETAAPENGDNISLSKEWVHDSMALVVKKAMLEPHFGALYANFIANLANMHKIFKKTALALCQEAFEETDKYVEPDLSESSLSLDQEAAELNFAANLHRKKSMGLMKFIGELYKLSLIKSPIMMMCLERLLLTADEERLECFAKLMTTIGSKLHAEGGKAAEELIPIWNKVQSMASNKDRKKGPVAPNLRIRFLFQDLIELKQNGWVQRRKEETAKTIQEIHQEVAAEEANRGSKTARLAASTTTAAANNRFRHSPSADSLQDSARAKKANTLRRAKSEVAKDHSQSSPKEEKQISPQDCGKKMKSLVKEFLVGGDLDEALLTMDQLVGGGSIEQGAAVVQAGVLHVLELKLVEVQKFQTLIRRCLEEKKIQQEYLVAGLQEPLELLSDIQIDAPLATKFLSMLVADWIGSGDLSFGFLLDAPEAFLSERPADFAALVLQNRGAPFSDDEVKIVEALRQNVQQDGGVTTREWIASHSA